ncbi:MAG TPA: hypothetical protein VER96_30775 [Polyangiaceae bacterium]|nr:hypothetical protein [Polyangiaceae bacterium]
MPIPENFKYDVRVRERMLKRGLLTESELTKHVDALADVTDQVIEVELKQPALVKESEREARVLPRTAPRPVVAPMPVRSLENELNDIDDDDDDFDDEDDDDVKVKAAPKAAEKAAAPAETKVAAVPVAAPAAAESEDDEDEDDEDEDDEDEDDEDDEESET